MKNTQYSHPKYAVLRNGHAFDSSKLYFTSDQHFGHKNIISFCDRPFKDTIQMEQELIKRWNEKVPKDGIVFCLGDMFWSLHQTEVKRILEALNGEIHYITGNHDQCLRNIEYLFASFNHRLEIIASNVNDRRDSKLISLCHYAELLWNNSHRDSWLLYGHSHNSLQENPNSKSFDIGVDCNDYYPFSFSDIKLRMAAKNPLIPLDHHVSNNR